MPTLSWNEIKQRAVAFSKEWEGETRELAEAKTFWDQFFYVFGISRRRVASFEKNVKKLNDKDGFIDLFWPGHIIVEHKSRGKDLDKAFQQAIDYFPGLKEHELPRYILVSDFNRFRVHDLEESADLEFSCKDFVKNVHHFGFIAGFEKRTYKEEDPVNIDAAERMGRLHDRLEEVGYSGHSLEVYLVRLLFCLFAEDTGIFEKGIFQEYIEQYTKEDGSDLAMHLAQIFQVLNTPKTERLRNLDESLDQFPYVNGSLFEEHLRLASFDSSMRENLLFCCSLNWSKISPAIFGSMFQAAMDKEERRNLGAHYTSEKNILKLIKPLFLDQLYLEFKKSKGSTKKLQRFHKKIAQLNFLDPACGCGNFLIISYRELRLLETEVLIELHKTGTGFLNVSDIIWVDVDQFYGIEYDEFPARIAEVAMWLMDHQMNMMVSEKFGQYFVRLPLQKAATIVHANALRLNWEDVISKSELNYILGNPPFVGHQWRNKEQMEDMTSVWTGVRRANRLDYVTCWFKLAARYLKRTQIKAAFVATNSIAQGEQPSILWANMLQEGCSINFAYRTFKWDNEAKRNANVHVVIIGFAYNEARSKYIYEHSSIGHDEISVYKAININAYLINGPNIFIESRGKPLHNFPKMFKGSQPTDGGNLLLSEDEKNELVCKYPVAEEFIRPLLGSREFLQNIKRYCLWLKNVDPQKYNTLPSIVERLKKVKEFRQNSATQSVRNYSKFPTLFTQDRQPDTAFLVVPKVSSQRRVYVPIGFISENVICTDLLNLIPNASYLLYGFFTVKIAQCLVELFCGRLKSDYRYSSGVYNNFPFPNVTDLKKKRHIQNCAKEVLAVRKEFPNSSLADLYDPLLMPPRLVRAHDKLDRAVEICYRSKSFISDNSRIEFLFNLYDQYTRPLEVESEKKKKSEH